MRIILISGSGIGAGKTTLARKLTNNVYSLADAIRWQLAEEYPDVDFFDKTQEAKSKLVRDTGLTVRDLLKWEGSTRRAVDVDCWVAKLVSVLRGENYIYKVAVDDIRFLNEVAFFRDIFEHVVHLHIIYSKSTPESEFENEELAKIADYIITRNDFKST